MPNTREKAAKWFADRAANTPMPGARAMFEIAADALQEKTVQEWISVKDRLPTWRDGKVLVFTKYGFSICERTVNNRWQGQHANWITHWAYLPQPPKGE